MIKSKKLYLKKLTKSDVNIKYINWLNDKEINKYLEARHYKHTLGTQKKYISGITSSKNTIIFGIFTNNNIHIGIIKIGPIDNINKTTDISYLIGDKNYHRKGYSFDSIKVCESFIFNKLKLAKINAGVYCNNIASIKLLKKLGYKKEFTKKKHFVFNNKRIDVLVFSKFK